MKALVFLGALILFLIVDHLLRGLPPSVFQWLDNNSTGMLIGLIVATAFWNFGRFVFSMGSRHSNNHREVLH